MKTIKERAEKYGIESANLLCSDWSEKQRERQAEIYAKVYSKIATEQRQTDIEKVCADNVITSLAKVMLDPTISCKTKTELARIILTKAMEE